MPAPDDFTKALLHRIQDERTTPQGGWLDVRAISSLMGLSARERTHLGGPLQELFEAGMIERRFNAVQARDEWRSRGVLATPGRLNEAIERAEAAAVPLPDPDPAPSTIFPVTIAGKIHAAFVLDYRTDRWATMCGRQVKDPSTVEHRRMPVQCHACAEALT